MLVSVLILQTGTMVGVTPEDLEMGYRLVSTSPGYLSKWTKQELTSAAMALRFFVRKLPGGPKLLRRVADLANQAPGEEAERMGHAIKAIEHQEGVDASLYRMAEEDLAATSTQVPGAAGPGAGAPDASLIAARGGGGTLGSSSGNGSSGADERNGAEEDTEMDVPYSQIPSGQRGGAAAERDGDGGSATSSSTSSNNTRNNASNVNDRKVSDSSVANSRVRGTRPPPRSPNDGAGWGHRGGEVDAVAGGPAVARGDAVVVGQDRAPGPINKNKNKNSSGPSGTGAGAARICNRVWIGKTCNKEHNGCRFAHPLICSTLNCRGCNDFHPPGRIAVGNAKGGVRQGSGASNKGRPKQSGGGSGSTRRGRNNHSNRNNNNGSNSRTSPTYSQLQERVASMRLQLSRERERGIRKELRELKEMTGSTSHSNNTLNSSNDANTSNIWWAKARARDEVKGTGACARAQPSQAFLDAVVTAVFAVMTDGQQKGTPGGLYRF